MASPCTVVAFGGVPVTESPVGTPFTPTTNGFPVTIVPNFGIPVVFISATGVLMPGGGGGASDTIPNAFTFTDVFSAALSTVYTSNSIAVAGINVPSPISITGGTYSVNGGSYTSASGSVSLGDSITVRLTSSGSNSTAANATLTIGGVSDTYTVTTLASGGSLAGQPLGLWLFMLPRAA